MCGRFTRRVDRKTVAADFGLALDQVPELDPRYNVAPTQEILIVRRRRSGAREAALSRWGLIPSWANDAKIGNQLINARAETLSSKPSFRNAFKSRRCLVVADGFYEWRKTGKQKQPYHICLVDGEPFGFAGLWETWHAPDGEVVESSSAHRGGRTPHRSAVVRPAGPKRVAALVGPQKRRARRRGDSTMASSTCTTCNGTGKCPTCDGTGTGTLIPVTPDIPQPVGIPGIPPVPQACPRCGGTGECPDCGASKGG